MGWKLWLDRPGVYAVELDALPGGAGDDPVPRALRVEAGEMTLPSRLEEDASGASRLLFVAESSLFEPRDVNDGGVLEVVRLLDSGPASAAIDEEAAGSRVADLAEAFAPASVRRSVRLETNVVRAPLSQGDEDEVATAWYWAMLSQQPSSALEVAVDGVMAREGPGDDLFVQARVLGWSRTRTPEGVDQHRVEAFWNGTSIGEAGFDGRRSETLSFGPVPADLVRPEGNRLRFKVPPRVLPGEGDPLVDIVYLDRVEITYPVEAPIAAASPLIVPPSTEPLRLSGGAAGSESRLWSPRLGLLPRNADGSWSLPAAAEADELWLVAEDLVRSPVAVERLRGDAPPLPKDLEYLVVAAPGLVAGAERLAEIHRGLGRTVTVVDVEAVYDAYGGGRRAPEAIRRYIAEVERGSGALRWVLLVGDADWFEPDDGPSEQAGWPPPTRVPSWTVLSRYGPAVSDHAFVRDPNDPTRPRFALGRIPAVDAAGLAVYVDKVAAWLRTPSRPGRRPVLLLSDASPGSLLQLGRTRGRLGELPVELIEPRPAASAEAALDEEALAAFARRPWIVYFGGHGSRLMWELGTPGDPRPDSFFDLEDIGRLQPTAEPPIVLSISCATAPFDHPTAGSLGESMILAPERGAVAFIGASSPLETPPVFGAALVRELLERETVGEAFAAAKRRLGLARVSDLYNLLGDPALPSAPQGPEPGADEQ